MKLTDRVYKTAPPGPKVRKLSDGQGLQLWIQPTGSRQWRFAYRLHGKQKVLSIGGKGITKISPADVLVTLRRVESRGRYETARRMRSTIGAVFRYAVATARADNDPTAALKGALITPKVTPRPAITDPKAFGALLECIASYDGQPTTRTALLLMAYLFPRPGELRQAEWREFDFDKAIWSIPPERTKMRRPHRSPIGPYREQRRPPRLCARRALVRAYQNDELVGELSGPVEGRKRWLEHFGLV